MFQAEQHIQNISDTVKRAAETQAYVSKQAENVTKSTSTTELPPVNPATARPTGNNNNLFINDPQNKVTTVAPKPSQKVELPPAKKQQVVKPYVDPKLTQASKWPMAQREVFVATNKKTTPKSQTKVVKQAQDFETIKNNMINLGKLMNKTDRDAKMAQDLADKKKVESTYKKYNKDNPPPPNDPFWRLADYLHENNGIKNPQDVAIKKLDDKVESELAAEQEQKKQTYTYIAYAIMGFLVIFGAVYYFKTKK